MPFNYGGWLTWNGKDFLNQQEFSFKTVINRHNLAHKKEKILAPCSSFPLHNKKATL